MIPVVDLRPAKFWVSLVISSPIMANICLAYINSNHIWSKSECHQTSVSSQGSTTLISGNSQRSESHWARSSPQMRRFFLMIIICALYIRPGTFIEEGNTSQEQAAAMAAGATISSWPAVTASLYCLSFGSITIVLAVGLTLITFAIFASGGTPTQ